MAWPIEPTATTHVTARGRACAADKAIAPPAELPTTANVSWPSSSISASACAVHAARSDLVGGGDAPKPSRSGAITRKRGASAAISGVQAAAVVPGPEPCKSSTGGPEPSASISGGSGRNGGALEHVHERARPLGHVRPATARDHVPVDDVGSVDEDRAGVLHVAPQGREGRGLAAAQEAVHGRDLRPVADRADRQVLL